MRSIGARRGATAVAMFGVMAATITVVGTGPAAAAVVCSSGVVGDVNGDGYAEVAVSVDGKGSHTGSVQLFYGGPDGLAVGATGTSLDDQYLDQDSPGVPGTAKARDFFGISTALGDLNGDGCADLVVGALNDRAAVGSVTVLYGSPAGVTPAGAQFFSPDKLFGATEKHTWFGTTLVIADLDHDGRNDLAISAPYGSHPGDFAARGSVVVIFGAAAGLNGGAAPLVVDQLSAGVPGAPVKASNFGTSLAAGDFDGDGAVELAVGMTAQIDSAARESGVQVLDFDGAALAADQPAQITQETAGVPGEAGDGDWFGASLAAGDVDGDGKDDLAVGAPLATPAGRPAGSEGGTAVVLRGSAAGLTGSGSQVWSRTSPGIEGAPGANFGLDLAMGRLNGDTRDDLIIGTPGDPSDSGPRAGGVVVLFGAAVGLSANGALSLRPGPTGVGGTAQPESGFGYSVAAAFVQSPTQASVVIGAPYARIGSRAAVGQILQLSISPAGPVPTGSRVIHPSVPGVKGVAEKYGKFGYTLG